MNPSYIDFFEERLDLGINFGAVGGPSFNTKIVTNGAGEETRNAEWWQPLGRWQLGEKMLLDSDAESIAELQYLQDFHRDRRGSYQAFRFRDWADYKVSQQQIGTTDGVTRIWQLKKTYTAGDVIFNRPITKPVVGSVRVFLNGISVEPVIDSVNGLIIFDEPPIEGLILTADFEFDVPVIFEADKIEYQLKAAQLKTGEYLHRLGSVFVKEIKINLVIPWYEFFAPPELLNVPLDLGTILDTTETTAIRTREEKTVSGFERRQNGYLDPKTVIKLPSKKFDREELDLLLGYFWVAKGKCANFRLLINGKTYLARFDSDALSIKFSAQNNDDTDITSLSGNPTRRVLGLYEVNLVFLGILEQKLSACKLSDSETNNLKFLLTGNGYELYSYRDVGLENNSYKFEGGNGFITVGDEGRMELSNYNFILQADVKLDSFNPNQDENVIAQKGFYSNRRSPTNFNNSYLGYYFAILNDDNFGVLNFTFKNTFGAIVSVVGQLPNYNYFSDFVRFRVQRENDVFSLYYGNQLIAQENIANQEVSDVTDRLTIGSPLKDSRNYSLDKSSLIGSLRCVSLIVFN